MPEHLTVVYAARTLQDAYLLRNLLAEAGIRAMVTNEFLQGGSRVDVVGWATLARVVVAEEDAPRARDIALDFDQRPAAADDEDSLDEEEPSEEESPVWPKCPQCGAPRTTRCPVCQTSGREFPAADSDPSGIARLVCTTCDEPFVPEDARRCHQCGHEFAEGYSAGPSGDVASDAGSLGVRVVIVLLGVLALLAVLAGWLIRLFR